jgi:hypothetical protein
MLSPITMILLLAVAAGASDSTRADRADRERSLPRHETPVMEAAEIGHADTDDIAAMLTAADLDAGGRRQALTALQATALAEERPAAELQDLLLSGRDELPLRGIIARMGRPEPTRREQILDRLRDLALDGNRPAKLRLTSLGALWAATGGDEVPDQISDWLLRPEGREFTTGLLRMIRHRSDLGRHEGVMNGLETIAGGVDQDLAGLAAETLSTLNEGRRISEEYLARVGR